MPESSILRIIHIASGDLWAGAEVQLYTLASWQQQFGMQVRVILLNPGRLQQELQHNGISVDIIDESHHHAGQIFMRLLALLRKHRPDMVHTHRTKENILGGIAAWLNRIASVRTVHGASEHLASWRQPHKKLQYKLDRLVGNYLQKAVIAVSEELASHLSRQFSGSHIHMIANGLDVEQTIKRASGTEKDCTTDKNGFCVGLVGRLVEVKRADLFIDLAQIIGKTKPELDIRFMIYGDGPLRQSLQQYCDSLNPKPAVRFMGHSETIQRDLAQLDCLLIVSDHEGLPMVLLEAMALRTVVIAHAVGAIPEVLAHGQCGVLIKGQNMRHYADSLTRLHADRHQRDQFANMAFSRVCQYYSARQNAEQCIKLYQKILETGGSRFAT